MSSSEFHMGKLIPVNLEGKSTEEFFKSLCFEKSVTTIGSYNKTWEAEYRCGFDKEFYRIGESIWRLENHVEKDDSYFVDMRKNTDGSIDFVASFYNGGTHLGEIIEDGISSMRKNGSDFYRE